MNSKGRTVQKTAILEFSLVNGSIFYGRIFLPIQGRLVDVLNDDRQFLPVESVDGAMLALSKASIRHVTLTGTETAA